MANQQTLQGNWNEIKGKLRKRWSQLTDNDLPERQGDVDQLVGAIQRKTGEGREAIENYLHEVTGQASSAISGAAERVRQYAGQAVESAQGVGRQAAEQVRSGYEEAEQFVRDQPAISLGVCFGLGVVTGLLVGLSLRAR